MYIYAEIATSGVNNWAILRDWHGGVLTKLVISYPILELASIFWYHWMCNIQEGNIHMLTYTYNERNQPQIIKIRATTTFLVCLSPRVKCTQHPVWCRSLTFMLCSLYPVYLGWKLFRIFSLLPVHNLPFLLTSYMDFLLFWVCPKVHLSCRCNNKLTHQPNINLRCVCVRVRVRAPVYIIYMYVCPSAMILKWHNIVNSQNIAIQLYMRVDIPWGTLLLKFDTLRAPEQLSWKASPQFSSLVFLSILGIFLSDCVILGQSLVLIIVPSVSKDSTVLFLSCWHYKTFTITLPPTQTTDLDCEINAEWMRAFLKWSINQN